MADIETTPSGQAPPVSDTPQGQEPETPEGQEPEGQQELGADAGAIRDARREAQALRKRLRDAESALAEVKAKDLSETERLRLQLQEAEAKRQATEAKVLRLTVEGVARDLGFKSPALAARLIDAEQIVNGDDGSPTNVKDLLAQLLKNSPELKGGAAGTPGANPAAANDQKAKVQELAEVFPWLKKRLGKGT